MTRRLRLRQPAWIVGILRRTKRREHQIRFVFGELFATLACLLLAARVEVLIRLRPVSEVASALGVPLDTGPEHILAIGMIDPPLSAKEARELKAVSRIMRRWPFATGKPGDGICLRESLLGGHYLRQRNPVLRIGVKKDGDTAIFHAWIEVSGINIGGYGFLPLSNMATGS